MNINDITKQKDVTVELCSLDQGDYFLYKNQLYVYIEESSTTAWGFEQGRRYQFCLDDFVTKVTIASINYIKEITND